MRCRPVAARPFSIEANILFANKFMKHGFILLYSTFTGKLHIYAYVVYECLCVKTFILCLFERLLETRTNAEKLERPSLVLSRIFDCKMCDLWPYTLE